MNIKKKLSIINHIEANFPVDKIVYKDLKVWPIIRWIHTYKIGISQDVNSPQKNVLTKKVHKTIGYLNNVYLDPLIEKFTRTEQEQIKAKNSSLDILSIVGGSHRNEIVDGKYFCRFIDSLFHFVPKCSKEILEFNFTTPLKRPAYFPSKVITPRLANAFLKASILNRIRIKSESIYYLQEYWEYIESLNFDIKFSKKFVAKQVYLVHCYKKVFDEILAKNKPKLVLFPCFYTPVLFGAILACNEKKIPTIEIQHGQQGDHHLMYTHWKNIPHQGYKLLPTHFWMWGKQSTTRIKSWADNTNRHQVIMGGNPWLAYCFQRDINVSQEEGRSFTKIIEGKKYKVLIAMQYVQDFYDSCIIKAMQQMNNSFIWLIRMHPRMLSQKAEVEVFLKKNNCQNYELEFANKLPVYYLFKRIDIQITYWSTVAYEALVFDVHTILIHRNGYDAMKDYVDKGIFAYTQDGEELIQLIKKRTFKRENTPYVFASSSLVIQEIENLLKIK